VAGEQRTPKNPRSLRPSELCQLLNSTPLGEAIGGHARGTARHSLVAGMLAGHGVDVLAAHGGGRFLTGRWRYSPLATIAAPATVAAAGGSHHGESCDDDPGDGQNPAG